MAEAVWDPLGRLLRPEETQMNPRQIGLGLTLLILASLAGPADAAPPPPGGALKRLCELVNCVRPPASPAPPPYISSWSSPCGAPGIAGCVTPYGVVSIYGNGFGYSSPGKVQLCGGLPGGSGCVDLQIVSSQWFDGFIMATLPFIEGVTDRRVNLYVTRADG